MCPGLMISKTVHVKNRGKFTIGWSTKDRRIVVSAQAGIEAIIITKTLFLASKQLTLVQISNLSL